MARLLLHRGHELVTALLFKMWERRKRLTPRLSNLVESFDDAGEERQQHHVACPVFMGRAGIRLGMLQGVRCQSSRVVAERRRLQTAGARVLIDLRRHDARAVAVRRLVVFLVVVEDRRASSLGKQVLCVARVSVKQQPGCGFVARRGCVRSSTLKERYSPVSMRRAPLLAPPSPLIFGPSAGTARRLCATTLVQEQRTAAREEMSRIAERTSLSHAAGGSPRSSVEAYSAEAALSIRTRCLTGCMSVVELVSESISCVGWCHLMAEIALRQRSSSLSCAVQALTSAARFGRREQSTWLRSLTSSRGRCICALA